MNTIHQNGGIALVISRDCRAASQALKWLEHRGYSCKRIEPSQASGHPDFSRAALLLVDIAHTGSAGVALLHLAAHSNPAALRIPLCRGGNTPSMRMARATGVDGFLYLNPVTEAIDFQRGFAAADNPTAAQLRVRSTGATTMSHACHADVTMLSSRRVSISQNSIRSRPCLQVNE